MTLCENAAWAIYIVNNEVDNNTVIILYKKYKKCAIQIYCLLTYYLLTYLLTICTIQLLGQTSFDGIWNPPVCLFTLYKCTFIYLLSPIAECMTLKACCVTDECTCQSMVSWEFQQLDSDFDGHLSRSELVPLKRNSDKVEAACIDKFTATCDHDKDGTLSEKEWCCCYADVCEWSSAYLLVFFLP